MYPADDLVGLGEMSVSPGAREFCCSRATAEDFAQASRDMGRQMGMKVSAERLRQIAEGEGRRVMEAQRRGELLPSWSAKDAKVPGESKTRLYVGIDGVMVRTITQDEKSKRRAKHAVRRRMRGKAGVGNTKPLAPPKPGADQSFKEFKVGVFYDQNRTHVQAFATHLDHADFGKLLEEQARLIGWLLADEKVSLTDGAVWIRNRVLEYLQPLDAMLLDFYHMSEHLWEAARACFKPEQARIWAEQQLHDIMHVGPLAVLGHIKDLEKRFRSEEKLEALRLLYNYLSHRYEMLDYRRARAMGWHVGSGPTEAMCKNLTLRLKRTGMKWDADNAAAMMALQSLHESNQWTNYWNTRKCG